MRISVKLAAYTGRPVPGIGRDGRGCWDLAEDTTLHDALLRLEALREAPVMTLVNSLVVRPDSRARYRLADGDCLVVMPPIDGG